MTPELLKYMADLTQALREMATVQAETNRTLDKILDVLPKRNVSPFYPYKIELKEGDA